MNGRSRLYFKFQKAFKLISTPKGRAWLAEKGLHPLHFTVSEKMIAPTQSEGYMINKRGDIVGTTNSAKPASKVYVPIQPVPTHTTIRFEFTSPDKLNEIAGYE